MFAFLRVVEVAPHQIFTHVCVIQVETRVCHEVKKFVQVPVQAGVVRYLIMGWRKVKFHYAKDFEKKFTNNTCSTPIYKNHNT